MTNYTNFLTMGLAISFSIGLNGLLSFCFTGGSGDSSWASSGVGDRGGVGGGVSMSISISELGDSVKRLNFSKILDRLVSKSFD